MQWIPGDKCVLNEAVFSRFDKGFGLTVCRDPEVYIVAAIDPFQAVVIIIGKKGPTPVLATWILPVTECFGGRSQVASLGTTPSEDAVENY